MRSESSNLIGAAKLTAIKQNTELQPVVNVKTTSALQTGCVHTELMKNIKCLLFTGATVLLSVLVTVLCYHIFVFGTFSSGNGELHDRALTQEEVQRSPVRDEKSVIKVISYACTYCAASEDQYETLKAKLPEGISLRTIHATGMPVFGDTAEVFATLQTMGLENRFRESAYYTVLLKRKNLSDRDTLYEWLRSNNINIVDYVTAENTEETKRLVKEMADINRFYAIQATPSYIVNRKHVILSEADTEKLLNRIINALENE